MNVLYGIVSQVTATPWLASLVILAAGGLLVAGFSRFVVGALQRRAARTTNGYDDLLVSLLRRALVPALYLGVAYLGIRRLFPSGPAARVIDAAGVALLAFIGARFVVFVIDSLLVSRGAAADAGRAQGAHAAMPIVKAVVYLAGLFFVLDNMGFKVSALLAGLGIGGVAIALAGQAVLKDLFGYFVILFDKPFEIGDFIVVGEYLGTVEHVGIKTTRLRSLGGEQLVLANADLTDARVRNYKRMVERRVLFQVGVVYDTGAERLREIPGMIREIVEGIGGARFDRAHFARYDDSQLTFEIVYYVLASDYNAYMDVQQRINLAIYEAFERRGIGFAFPTRTVHVHQEGVA